MSDIQLSYDKEEPSSFNITIAVLGTVVVLIIVFVFTYYLFTSMLSQDQNQKYDLVKTTLLDKYNKEYSKNMNQLKWIDKDKGIVKVPIEFGIEQVVKDYN